MFVQVQALHKQGTVVLEVAQIQALQRLHTHLVLVGRLVEGLAHVALLGFPLTPFPWRTKPALYKRVVLRKLMRLPIGLDVAQRGVFGLAAQASFKAPTVGVELLLTKKYPRAQQLCVLLLQVGQVGFGLYALNDKEARGPWGGNLRPLEHCAARCAVKQRIAQANRTAGVRLGQVGHPIAILGQRLAPAGDVLRAVAHVGLGVRQSAPVVFKVIDQRTRGGRCTTLGCGRGRRGQGPARGVRVLGVEVQAAHEQATRVARRRNGLHHLVDGGLHKRGVRAVGERHRPRAPQRGVLQVVHQLVGVAQHLPTEQQRAVLAKARDHSPCGVAHDRRGDLCPGLHLHRHDQHRRQAALEQAPATARCLMVSVARAGVCGVHGRPPQFIDPRLGAASVRSPG